MSTAFRERRKFLKQAAAFALTWRKSSSASLTSPLPLPNPVGYATIAWPQNQFNQALETISRLGFKGVQMLGWVRDSYAGPKLERLRERLSELKLKPVALSCSNLKLDPAHPTDEAQDLRAYATFFQRLGGLYLQVTDRGEPDRRYPAGAIQGLGRRMNTLGRMAQDFGLALGYHPHFGTLGETRQGLGSVLDATDPRYVKLIPDLAHLALGGADPAEVIRTYHMRVIFSHFKDLRKDVAALAQKSRDRVRTKEFRFCEIGDGVVNFRAVLQAFQQVNFRGWVIVELDAYELPHGGPAESARKSKQAVELLGLGVSMDEKGVT